MNGLKQWLIAALMLSALTFACDSDPECHELWVSNNSNEQVTFRIDLGHRLDLTYLVSPGEQDGLYFFRDEDAALIEGCSRDAFFDDPNRRGEISIRAAVYDSENVTMLSIEDFYWQPWVNTIDDRLDVELVWDGVNIISD